jgi:ATP synthase protein I
VEIIGARVKTRGCAASVDERLGFLRIIKGFAKLLPFVTCLKFAMTISPESDVQAHRVANTADSWEDGWQEPEFKSLTREEAREWRGRQPTWSIWRLVVAQLIVGLLLGGLSWLLTQRAQVAWSVLYGSAAVVIPSALMAYGLTSSALARLMAGVAQAAFVGFLFWEGVKVLLAVAMLWLAPQVVPELSWLGLLLGLVVTLKVYWAGFLIQSRRSKQNV